MRRALLSLLFLYAAGCVPGRSNPHDPSRAPDVRIDVLKYLRDDQGNCQPENIEVVAAASRGDCLVLDVSRTTDPQGHDLTFTYTYFVLDSQGEPIEELPVSPESVSTDAEQIEVPRSALGVPPLASVRFAVRAKDSTGAVSTGFLTLGLVNSPPVLPLPGERLLPEGGFPWALGDSMEITLDGQIATDPDDDDLRYCWSTPESALYECIGFDDTLTVTIEPAAGRRVFHLVANDGDLDSAKQSFVVRIGPAPLWDGAGGLRRFDETLRDWPEPAAGRSWIAAGELGEEWLLFQNEAAADIAIYEWPSLVDTGLTIDLAQAAELVTSTPRTGGGTRFWIAAPGAASSTDILVYDLDETGTALTPVRTANVAVSERAVLAADAFANAGLLGGGDRVAIVPANPAAQVQSFTNPGLSVRGGSARPQAHEEGGAAHFLLVATDAAGGNAYQSYRVTPALDVTQEVGPINEAMRQFQWVDHDRVWSLWLGIGLTLFDINTGRLYAQFPSIQSIEGPLHVDATGSCSFATASAIVTAFADETESRHPFVTDPRALDFVSSDGTLAIDDGNGVMRFSRTGSELALRATVDNGMTAPRRSIAFGGVWGVTPPAVVRVSDDGRPERFITILDVGGTAVPLAAPELAIDPDDRGGWLRDAGVLYRLNELEVDPDHPEYEEAFVVSAPATADGFDFIGAGSPATPPLLWMWDTTTRTLATLDTSGALAEIGPLTPQPVAAVVDPSTNDLCVFSVVDATTIRHHRFTPGGVEISDDVAVASSSGIRSPFTLASPPQCGVVVGASPSRVLVWDATASLMATLSDADDLSSATAVSGGIYWAAGEEAGTDDRFLTRMVVGSGGALTRTDTWTIGVPSPPVFLP